MSSTPPATTDLPPTPNAQKPSPSHIAYTTFTFQEKRLLTLLLGLTTITSPLTATIYFPLLPLLASHYQTSPQAINLTITIYIVFQALSPALFATLSDSLGRRIIFLVTLTLYVLSNLGLALEHNSYAALIVLRALQSLGASAAFAVSYGVVADVCVPSARGQMVGPVSMALNLGTLVGPVVGGWVAFKSGDYTWVFRFLCIIGVILLIAVGGLLPETARTVVGNGSLLTSRWWERAWGALLLEWGVKVRKRSSQGKDHRGGQGSSIGDQTEGRTAADSADGDEHPTRAKKTLKIFNPLSCLRIIFWKDAAQILWVHASFYLVDYSIQASIPSAFKDIYHFNELEIGLSYLPRGAGIILGGYANGKLMDRNYKATANQIGHTVDSDRGDDLSQFPIEKARTRGSLYFLAILACDLIGYGWALQQGSHVSIPLILQFIQGFLGTSIYTFSNTLLVDIFPETPSTAAAAASITRCALAAAGVAVVQPLISAIGRGWYFTALGLITGVAGSVAVWMIRTWGMKWRVERIVKTSEAHRMVSSDETYLNNLQLEDKCLPEGTADTVRSNHKGVVRE